MVAITASPGEDNPVTAWFIDKLAPPLISGLLLTVVASVVIARSMERYRGRREHLTRAVDALRLQLAAVQSLGAEYWSAKLTVPKALAIEAELEFTLQDISALAKISAPDLWKTRDSEGPSLVAELLDKVTGPDFGKPTHVPDLNRVREIATRAALLSAKLTTDRHRFMSKGKLFG